MAKKFTEEELMKKHGTNIKSAVSGFGLAGVLGLIYIIRYFISGNFNFYFSLTFTELMLRLYDKGSLPLVAAIALIVVFVALYIAVVLLCSKKPEKLRLALGLYLADSLCLIGTFLLHEQNIQSDFFIDAIVHLFVILFLVVGVKSAKVWKQ